MSDRAAKTTRQKAKSQQQMRRSVDKDNIPMNIIEVETESEEEDNKKKYQKQKDKGKSIEAPKANQGDPTRETVTIYTGGSQSNGVGNVDWRSCSAKFDCGADDDWISERLVRSIGFFQDEAEAFECTNFDGTKFISDKHIEGLTWLRKGSKKTISGSFRIMPNAPYDLVIGSATLFRKKIMSVDPAPRARARAAGVLVTRKLTKEEIAANKAKAEKQKADSEALLLAQQARMTQGQPAPTQPVRNNNGRNRP